MNSIRVRFAPSPTGPLHIGGVRTALFNYLLARKHNGVFILRIEDTDQTRYVPGAEDYIIEALKWCGLEPDEGPGFGGEYGPYRQSDRKALYKKYARQLLESGHVYYAFDTPEELDALRAQYEAEKKTFTYNAEVRKQLNNSLALPEEEVKRKLEAGEKYVLRFKIPEGKELHFKDIIRGEMVVNTSTLDDKVLFKSDGMPTYHLANIVDDHLMEISHVVRGEEWLPSLPLHVLLYRAFGWQAPQFAHLPLILKPVGKGKLSKRDGVKLGIPVFPLAWQSEKPEDAFTGFREEGFDPAAMNNFLAFLGWNPGTEQELFSMKELEEVFSIDKVGKAGARFDFDKARWYNQQYIKEIDDKRLAAIIRPFVEKKGYEVDDNFLVSFCGLMKERVSTYNEFLENGYYFFEDIKAYDEKTIRKKWKPENRPLFDVLVKELEKLADFSAPAIQKTVETFIRENELSFGAVLPILRIAVSGTMKGPAVFEMMELLGKDEVLERIRKAYEKFQEIKNV